MLVSVLCALLGAGGMGEVYLAEHPRLSRLDALKVLPIEMSRDQEFAERFNREADLTAGLWHPHIIGVHDRGEVSGRLWISMDFVDGIDAARLLASHPGGVPVADVLDIVDAVADALDFAHFRGLLHRDVKPANILLSTPEDDRKRILLADFGIGRELHGISGLTATNMTLGTISYAAPEQLLGEDLDGRADQYALAATTFHLLTGTPVFDHTNPAVVISRTLHVDPHPLGTLKPELSRMDPVLARALAKSPTDRFDRCRDLAAALRLAPVPSTRPVALHQPNVDRRTRPGPLESPAITSAESRPSPTAPTQMAPVPTHTDDDGVRRALSSNGIFKRRAVWAALAGVALIAVVAVGLWFQTSGPEETTKGSTPTSGTAGSASSTAVAPESTVPAIPVPPQIAASGVLRVGTNVPYAPMEFKDTEGQVVGVDIDIIRAIADELGVEAQFSEFDFSQLVPSVQSNVIDVAAAAMTDTKQREGFADWVTYYSGGILWAQNPGPPIDPNNACGLTVAVQLTTTEETDELPAKSQACVAANRPPINVLAFDSQDQAFNAVIDGKAQAASADSAVTAYAIKMSGGRLKAAGQLSDAALMGFAVAKGSSLAQTMQQAIQRLLDSGRYTEILDRWG